MHVTPLLTLLCIMLQELPFVLIGIGVDDMFIITATFDDTDAVSTNTYYSISACSIIPASYLSICLIVRLR
jgi:Sterol-sensing domain of SREBP cleavage-activation